MKKQEGQSKYARLWIPTKMELATVCMYCGHEKQSKNQWQPSTNHHHKPLSHGVCPTCFTTAVAGMMHELHDESCVAEAL